MVELYAIKVVKGEEVVAAIIPETGKMGVEDMANLLGMTAVTIKSVIQRNNIGYHRIGRKWIADLEDFWKKTWVEDKLGL